MKHAVAAAIGLMCLALLGCDITPLIREDTTRPDPAVQWRQLRNDFVIAFEAIPQTPTQGQQADFQVTIHDESKEPPQPITDASIFGIAAMPGTPGQVRELEFKSGMGAAAPGAYRARSSFDNKGKWLAKLLIHLSSGEKISVEFPFEVR